MRPELSLACGSHDVCTRECLDGSKTFVFPSLIFQSLALGVRHRSGLWKDIAINKELFLIMLQDSHAVLSRPVYIFCILPPNHCDYQWPCFSDWRRVKLSCLLRCQDRGVHSLMDELDIPPERALPMSGFLCCSFTACPAGWCCHVTTKEPRPGSYWGSPSSEVGSLAWMVGDCLM